MSALYLMIGALCCFVLAYRYYAAFIAAKVLMLDDRNISPSISCNDGQNYVPTNKWIVFGHHFAAIAGAGPLIGPVLAAQYGWGPGFFWILLGSVFAGCVHDMIILFASYRHQGQSLSVIAEKDVGKITGGVTAIVILFIIIVALAGLGVAVVNALFNNPWGVFSIAMTIPIAMCVGVYIFKIKPGAILSGSIAGFILVCAAVILGPFVADSSPCLLVYLQQEGSIRPPAALRLLCSSHSRLAAPRPAGLSQHLHENRRHRRPGGWPSLREPDDKMPFTTQFLSGGGPIIPGPWWPYVFITIACGAISGFHALIGSGTTPKMIEHETEITFIGYGAMLTEAFVGIMALLSAITLNPSDYFAINTSADVYAKLKMSVVDLPVLSQLVGLDIAHRPGWRHFAGRRHGACLCQHRRGAAAHDEVLVPVHHHV